MTTSNQVPLSWKVGVTSVLAEAGLTEADLARELGVNRATVHRYFTHRPNPETIWRVGDAVAALVLRSVRFERMPDEPGDDKVQRARFDISGYLQAIATFEFGDTGEAADAGLAIAFNFIDAYLEHAAVERIKAILARHTRKEMALGVPRSKRRVTKLGLRMLVEVRRIALDIARASYPTSSRFDRVAAIFERQDPSLKGTLKPRPEMTVPSFVWSF